MGRGGEVDRPARYDDATWGQQLQRIGDELQPSLLLFLRKLRRLEVAPGGSSAPRRMLWEDLAQGEVRITCDGRILRYLPVELQVRPPVPRLDVRVDGTTIALALELDADFVVPSNREAVDVDSAWNESLLHHIPELFVKMVEAAKARPGVLPLPSSYPRWLQPPRPK
ncbi:hypothetical protein CYMTET_55837 [Cymbomonas tetramitiformis]|uniref:Uncharacterized protein n=1 Tax=Cymbomonas tetramitiformis TaxID=36881 RepID=A0AAE0EME7_9CHLO|nr:hypothetical protein CYMTET_55837 [Cymbomonas tetramitiformis]